MARLDFRLPDIGEGIAEAEIVEWHADVGDVVKEGQVIASVMTDKATVEMEAPADGTLLERGGELGSMIPVRSVLFALETSDASAQAYASSNAAEARPAPVAPSVEEAAHGEADKGPARSVRASPAVRRRAKALGVDLSDVARAGDHVLHEELDRHLLATRASASKSAAGSASLPPGEEIRITGLRRQIAHRMEEAKRRIPHFTYVEEVDVTELERMRAALNRQRSGQPALHFLPFLVVALCRALKEFPDLNAHYDDEREVLTRFPDVHAGIATQTRDGLMVPVLRDAARRNLWEIAEGIADLAARARAGTLGRDELRGSTITVTSLGRLGGVAATPIINRPEVAIVAPHRIVERIAMTSLGSAPRLIMNLSISCDHRVIDGFVAASFVQAIKQTLEAPAGLADENP